MAAAVYRSTSAASYAHGRDLLGRRTTPCKSAHLRLAETVWYALRREPGRGGGALDAECKCSAHASRITASKN